MTIKAKYELYCDVCNELVQTYESRQDAERASSAAPGTVWVQIAHRGVLIKAHTLECAKIALNNADDTFRLKKIKEAFGTPMGISLDHLAPGSPVKHTGSDYMEREYGNGKHTGEAMLSDGGD